MNRRVWIVLTLAVVTVTSVGCTRCRNWLRRGSRCGTTTVAPAMMGNPVALGTPYVTPQQAPAVAAPAMAAPTMVPQMMAPQCIPQCIPICPQPCNPCPDMCYGTTMMSMPCEVPCNEGSYFGGYLEEGSSTTPVPAPTYEGGTYGGNTYVPGSTYAPPAGGGSTNPPAPGPTTENRANYPEEATKESTEAN